jgi:hypothetical protein
VDAAVPVPAMVLLEDLRDRSLDHLLRIGSLEAGLVIEERRPGQPSYVQEHVKPVFGLERDGGADLYGRSSSLKACTFSRKATSARKRSFSRRNRCT